MPTRTNKSRRQSRLVTGLLVVGIVLSIVLFFTPFVYDQLQSGQRLKIAEDYHKRAYPADKRRDAFVARYNANAYAHQQHRALPYPKVTYADIGDAAASFGYVRIPSINLKATPVYYGTSAKKLAKGVGALTYTSLPAPGKNVTASLTAHTGLANQIFFDNIRYLKRGDIVYVDAFAHQYAYAVDRQKVIDPTKPGATHEFDITDSANKIILMTCTPQGINDHRLLVFAHRVSLQQAKHTPVKIRDHFSLMNLWKYCFLFLLIALILTYWYYERRRRRQAKREQAHD